MSPPWIYLGVEKAHLHLEIVRNSPATLVLIGSSVAIPQTPLGLKRQSFLLIIERCCASFQLHRRQRKHSLALQQLRRP